jgi:hypothetical protein
MVKNKSSLYLVIFLVFSVGAFLWEVNFLHFSSRCTSAWQKKFMAGEPGWVEYKSTNKLYSIWVPPQWVVGYEGLGNRKNLVFFFPDKTDNSKRLVIEIKSRFDAEKILEEGLRSGSIKEESKIAQVNGNQLRVFSEVKPFYNLSVYLIVGDRVIRFYVEMPKENHDLVEKFFKVIATVKPKIE